MDSFERNFVSDKRIYVEKSIKQIENRFFSPSGTTIALILKRKKNIVKYGGFNMSKLLKIFISGILFVAMIGFSHIFIAGPSRANACGVGAQGGESYIPQRRGSTGNLALKSFITKEQAFEMVSQHIKRLNPNLKIGQLNDAGRLFEAEIVTEDNEVVQLIGVDKETGRLLLIN